MEKFTYMDLLTQLGIGGAHPGGIMATQELFKDEQITPDTVILDAGCGTGQTSAYLFEQYKANIIALDQHPVMVEKARKRFENRKMPIRVLQESIELTSLENESVDYCLSESVLSFVNTEAALLEMKRILRDGGYVLAIEITLNQPIESSDYQSIQSFYGFNELWEERDWNQAFTQAGFKSTTISTWNNFDEDAPLTEFHPSEKVHPAIMDILSIHEELLNQYKDVLSYRIIRARK